MGLRVPEAALVSHVVVVEVLGLVGGPLERQGIADLLGHEEEGSAGLLLVRLDEGPAADVHDLVQASLCLAEHHVHEVASKARMDGEMLVDAREEQDGPEVGSSAQSFVDSAFEERVAAEAVRNAKVAVARFL